MKNKTKTIVLNSFGIFFLLFSFLSFGNALSGGSLTKISFLCYLGTLIIGIGILTKKDFLILSQIYILFIPHLFWVVDFVYLMLNGIPLWGLTDYVFESSTLVGNIISVQHFFTIPLAIFALTLIKKDRKNSLRLALLQITAVYFFLRFFSPPELNINCVFKACINISLGLPYIVTWFILFFSIILVTSLAVNYLLDFLEKVK